MRSAGAIAVAPTGTPMRDWLHRLLLRLTPWYSHEAAARRDARSHVVTSRADQAIVAYRELAQRLHR